LHRLVRILRMLKSTIKKQMNEIGEAKLSQ